MCNPVYIWASVLRMRSMCVCVCVCACINQVLYTKRKFYYHFLIHDSIATEEQLCKLLLSLLLPLSLLSSLSILERCSLRFFYILQICIHLLQSVHFVSIIFMLYNLLCSDLCTIGISSAFVICGSLSPILYNVF